MQKTAQYEERLKTRLAELNKRLVDVEHALDEPKDCDSEERAVESENDELLEGLGNAGLAEIKAIEAALGRVAQGEYGACVTCGNDISSERLDLIPHAAQCRNCAT